MATELIERTIDGEKYEFEQMGTKEALRILTRISKMVGKPLALATGAVKRGDDGKFKLDETVLSNVAGTLFDRIDEDETIALVEMLCATKALCAGQKINFDRHYEGKLIHLSKVLSAALEVQYGDFFDAVKEFLGSRADADTTPAKQ
jgi:hypothetical protein